MNDFIHMKFPGQAKIQREKAAGDCTVRDRMGVEGEGNGQRNRDCLRAWGFILR